MNNHRRNLLHLVLPWAFYATAFTFSAAGIIRSVAIAREKNKVGRLLQIAESKIARLTSKNEELYANQKLSASLRTIENRNHDFIADFYHLCKGADDLPQLKTDFIVVTDSGIDLAPYGFVFSVPSGNHRLRISIEGDVAPEIIEIPLVPESGYFLRFRPRSEVADENTSLVAELSSNAPSFSTVQQALPTYVSQLATPPLNRKNSLFYPNETYFINTSKTQCGIGVAACDVFLKDGSTARVHIKIESEARLCVVGFVSSQMDRGRLEPYTGNGRFYLPMDEPALANPANELPR